ncbi:TIGR03435 family protein [Hymenobacter sp. UYP22]|uniref:TIGR03435 family protein n=1 Tax=Hymenobacter sp. UYP22 TaxID=3156348 RepID=UPI0033935E13
MHIRRFLSVTCLLGAPSFGSAQALHEGDQVPAFTLATLNSPRPVFSSAAVAGKLLILEFWGTWCSPCIPALLHLDSLQQAFPQQLQVVGVAADPEARVRTFLQRRPVHIPLAALLDEQALLYRYFPHRTVPHTVVIGPDGKVLAITNPKAITLTVIRQWLAGQSAPVEAKHDELRNPLSFFPADTSTRYALRVQPYLVGLGSQMRRDQTPGLRGRRVTFINTSLQNLVQQAYQVSHLRVQNQLPASRTSYEPANLFCLDLIVPPAESRQLFNRLRPELHSRFGLHVSVRPESRPVYVLRRLAAAAWPESNKPEQASWSGKGLEAEGSSVEVLREFLENMASKPVVNETNLAGHYDIKLAVQPEDKLPEVKLSLQKMGLTLEEATRTIDVVYMAEQKTP